jgi:hypothetical protein
MEHGVGCVARASGLEDDPHSKARLKMGGTSSKLNAGECRFYGFN